MSASVQRARDLSLGDPYIAGLSDGLIGSAIEIASRRLLAARWPLDYADALGLLALHLLVSAPGGPQSGAGGPVASETMGSWSKSYAVAAASNLTDQDLSSTTYGRQFVALRDAQPFIRSVV